jgi:hypothetical protein
VAGVHRKRREQDLLLDRAEVNTTVPGGHLQSAEQPYSEHLSPKR